MTYRHCEAFALMWYGCDRCGHHERMWNSRDGVTPFFCRCPSCGELSLRHVDWHEDKHAPDHKPFPGQRIWRNGTSEEAVAIIERRIAIMSASGHDIPQGEAEALIYAARYLKDEWSPGWPMMSIMP